MEDGEIDDGEKVKRAFIPRIPCKYYQRGKCTWGRGCKFLHPGVNDTGNFFINFYYFILNMIEFIRKLFVFGGRRPKCQVFRREDGQWWS